MRLPVEQLAEDVSMLSNVTLLDIVVQVKLHSSPFIDLWICLVRDQLKDFLAKLWDFEVGTCTIYFSEDTFIFRAFTVESRKG